MKSSKTFQSILLLVKLPDVPGFYQCELYSYDKE